MSTVDPITPSPYPPSHLAPHQTFLAPAVVWGLLVVFFVAALIDIRFFQAGARFRDNLTAICLLAAAASGLIIAVARIRGRTRLADGFFPLVLLSPLLYHRHRPVDPLDTTLLATALLGLMLAVIIAMKRNNLLRYFLVAALALALAALSKSFLMLLPALLAWLLYIGFSLAKSPTPKERTRGIIILTLGEILLLFFALGCFLEEPVAAPAAATLFHSIITFADFPLLVLSIVMLALGWHKGPHHSTPPHFLGTLALTVGLLTLLLNNFQLGKLPRPGTDQTVLELCLLYTISTLHGPRRLRWIVPPLLLLAAAGYTMFW